MGQGASTQTLNPNLAYITGEFVILDSIYMFLSHAARVLLFIQEVIGCCCTDANCTCLNDSRCTFSFFSHKGRSKRQAWTGECTMMECGDCAIGHSHVSFKQTSSQTRSYGFI